MATLPKQLQVDLVAVDSRVWSGQAQMVSATTTEGDIGILPGHAPLLGQLVEDSLVRIATEGGNQVYKVGGGYLSVSEEGVSLPVESAELVSPAA